MVSEMAGDFFRSSSRRECTNSTSWWRSWASTFGTRLSTMRSSSSTVGKGMYRCRQRRLRASEMSRVLLLVRNTMGEVRALMVPISGIEIW